MQFLISQDPEKGVCPARTIKNQQELKRSNFFEIFISRQFFNFFIIASQINFIVLELNLKKLKCKYINIDKNETDYRYVNVTHNRGCTEKNHQISYYI